MGLGKLLTFTIPNYTHKQALHKVNFKYYILKKRVNICYNDDQSK